ncbi:MAG: M20/M25/M40 family metallo-hydrolase [Desulfobacterales bacterium]|jgi:acetylornithine deacetylase|nr:M20/M25/M40 family metallo-hydrolase [Desulfobacterales bacterium]
MEERIIGILSDLVAVNSVNPTLSAGPGEGEIAQLIFHHLKRLGLEAELYSLAAARASVVGVVRGRPGRESMILNGHIDTVGVEGMEAPFALRREGDRLYGRGAYDMKGGVAVMLALADSLAAHPPAGDVWLTFSADEEDRSLGTEQLVAEWLPSVRPRPAAAVFLEPTEGEIGVGHKGFSWLEIEIEGRAAHGSRPEEGIDAIIPLHGALAELDRIRAELAARPPDPLLGRPSLHGGTLRGGSAPSVVPAHSALRWERRTLPGEPPQAVASELARVAGAVRSIPGGHRVKEGTVFIRPPYQTPADAAIIRRLQAAAPASKPVGLSFWADSALMGLAGIPSVLFGPAGHGAHAVDEWVSLKSLTHVQAVLQEAIRGDC